MEHLAVRKTYPGTDGAKSVARRMCGHAVRSLPLLLLIVTLLIFWCSLSWGRARVHDTVVETAPAAVVTTAAR